MNMKNIITILILAVFVTACAENVETGPSKDPFVGGTDGLIISYEEDAPPAEVLDGGEFPFDVVVKLKNEGEAAITKDKVTVTISGILASEFGKTEAGLSMGPEDDIEATRKDAEGTIVESNPAFVEFQGFNHVEELVGNTKFTLRADVCYNYMTTANSLMCVRINNLDTDEGVCVVNEDKEVFSSGAPIQVINFKETARAKDKLAFTFTIAHKGNGLIFQQDTDCANERAQEDKIWVEVETGVAGLECLGLRDGAGATGYTILYGDEKPITCTQTVATASDYEKPVVIRLMYDYKDSKEKSLLVKHSLG